MAIFSSIKIGFLTFFRLKYPIIILLLSIIYTSFLFRHFIFSDIFNPGEALIRSSFIVQGIILISMFFGVYTIRVEEQNNLNDIYTSIKGALFFHYLGRLIFFILIITIYCSLSIVVLWTFYFISGLPISMLYYQSVRYIILYWFLSALVGFFVGVLLSKWIKGKAIYPSLLVVWLLISPMNYPFITQLTILLNLKNPYDVINFLNIGQIDPHRKYDPLYGFPLESFNWYKKWFFLVITLLLLLTLISRKIKRVSFAYLLVGVFLLLTIFPIVKNLKSEEQVVYTGTEPQSINTYDVSYYRLNRSEMNIQSQDLTINKYDINFKLNPDLQLKVVTSVKNNGHDVSKINFTLYHDLKVSSIKYNGNLISFQQKKDQLTVKLPTSIKQNETFELVISYRGNSSPYYFANNQAIFLPYNFPWLPTINTGPAMKVDNFDIYKLSLQARNTVDYNLIVNDDKDIFVNLNKVGPNHWQGIKTNGLTIVSGSITRNKLANSGEIIYPYTWEKVFENPATINANFDSIISSISDELELSRPINIDSYLYLPITTGGEPMSNSIWINNEQMIVSLDDFYPIQGGSLEKYEPLMTYGFVPALTWKYDNLSFNNMKYPQLFSNSFAYWYNLRYQESTIENKQTYFNYFIENLDINEENDNESRRIKTISENLYNFINNKQIANEIKREFFVEWYKQMSKKNNNENWEWVEENLKNFSY